MNDGVAVQVLDILRQDLHLSVPSPDTDLLATGTLDSLGLVELLFQLEQRFGLRVQMDALDVEDVRSATRIAAYVDRLKGGNE